MALANFIPVTFEENRDTACRSPCVVDYKMDGNGNPPYVTDACPANTRNPAACIYTAIGNTDVYARFTPNGGRYSSLTVRNILLRFIDRGLDDAYGIFRGMKDVLFPHSSPTLNTDFTDNADDYTKCDDVVCKYRIGIRANPGAQYNFPKLFHISIHSIEPIYMMGRTRAVFGCAKYRHYPHMPDRGSFHYKIDLSSDLEHIENNQPFRKLNPIQGGNFAASQYAINIVKQTPEQCNYAIFHEYIYYRFIRYWNHCIQYIRNTGNLDGNNSPWYPLPADPQVQQGQPVARVVRLNDIRDDPVAINADITAALLSAVPQNRLPLSHTVTSAIPQQIIDATTRLEETRAAAIAYAADKRARDAAKAASSSSSVPHSFNNLKRRGNERRAREIASASASASASSASAASSAASAFRLNRPPEYRQVSNYGLGAASASAASALSAEEKAVENGEAAVAAAQAKRTAAEQRLEEARMAVAAARAIEEPLARALTQARAEVTAATAARPSKVKSASTIQAELIQKRSAEGLVKKQHLESHGKVAEALRKETFAQQAIASANVGIQKARANIERARANVETARRNAALRKQEATSASATSASAASASANNNNNINYSMFGNISNNKESNHPVASVNNRQSRQQQQQRRKSVRTPSPTPPGYNKERNRKEARKGGRTKKNNKKKRNTRKR